MSASQQKPLSVETIVLVRKHLIVDPASPSGLRWRSHWRGNCQYLVGKPAGTKNPNGYWHTGVAGRNVRSHRLVFFLETGIDTAHYGITVDHINRDPSDNRIENLRMATDSEQKKNQGYFTKPGYKIGSSGYRWVRAHGPGWRGVFWYKNKVIRCGTYPTPEEAYQAVVAKRREMGIS